MQLFLFNIIKLDIQLIAFTWILTKQIQFINLYINKKNVFHLKISSNFTYIYKISLTVFLNPLTYGVADPKESMDHTLRNSAVTYNLE